MLGGSLVAGIGSLGLVACSSNTDKAAGSANSPASGSTVAGDRQFVSANSFVSSLNGGADFRSGWPALEFPNAQASATVSFTLPTNASVIAIDLIWMSEDGGSGDVRWIGGIQWAASGTAINSAASGTIWREAVASVPAPRNPATTRLGDFLRQPQFAMSLFTYGTRTRSLARPPMTRLYIYSECR